MFLLDGIKSSDARKHPYIVRYRESFSESGWSPRHVASALSYQ